MLHVEAAPSTKDLLDAASEADPALAGRLAAGKNLHPVLHWG